MASRREVAEVAGVSMRTVSNVVNGHPHVSETTRSRVEQAIAELGYRPSELARTLKTGRSGLIGLVLPELDTAYFAELTRAFVEEGARRGLTVVIDQADGDRERERYFIDRTHEGAIFDALVINSLALEPSDLDEAGMDRPLVFLGENRFEGFDQVMTDNYAAVRDAMAHLVATGRRRIAAIGAERAPQRSSTIRLSAYEDALADAGLEPEGGLVEYVSAFRRREGASAMERLLDSDVRPDAVFCFSDALALGALRTLLARGVRVPDDIALVGYDDIEDGAFATPALTTISPDKQFIARVALDRIGERLDRSHTGTGELITAPHRLIVRESS